MSGLIAGWRAPRRSLAGAGPRPRAFSSIRVLYVGMIDAQLLSNSRYDVERWLRAHAQPRERIGTLFPRRHLPRLDGFDTQTIESEEDLKGFAPLYMCSMRTTPAPSTRHHRPERSSPGSVGSVRIHARPGVSRAGALGMAARRPPGSGRTASGAVLVDAARHQSHVPGIPASAVTRNCRGCPHRHFGLEVSTLGRRALSGGARADAPAGVYLPHFTTAELNASYYRWPTDAAFAQGDGGSAVAQPKEGVFGGKREFRLLKRRAEAGRAVAIRRGRQWRSELNARPSSVLGFFGAWVLR